MKKLFKRKSAVKEAPVEVDVAGLMDKIQQRLESLERKVDILINNQSSSRPQERPFRGGRSFGRGRDNNLRERSMTKVICAECGTECEVPFKPTADRPVYCRECFAKRKGGGSFEGKRNDSSGREDSGFHHKKKALFRRRK